MVITHQAESGLLFFPSIIVTAHYPIWNEEEQLLHVP